LSRAFYNIFFIRQVFNQLSGLR